ncbi:MAG: hypothetical protein L6Q71_00975 [Planctomycetes bacterium]|nr:hypothetical protein [Planctomycetota bacterium]NUQ35495.1 hypothetical protein [Planctomycetaceae bacterium]
MKYTKIIAMVLMVTLVAGFACIGDASSVQADQYRGGKGTPSLVSARRGLGTVVGGPFAGALIYFTFGTFSDGSDLLKSYVIRSGTVITLPALNNTPAEHLPPLARPDFRYRDAWFTVGTDLDTTRPRTANQTLDLGLGTIVVTDLHGV